ncbi:MAG: nuclear transport factor 2 family protein [Proteobacteria bacterium]|nr:nuclear transport factor 2 family protein [Pseudomonadota bacterium]
MYEGMPVARSRFEHADCRLAVFGQPVGQHAAGRARTDDHVVERFHCHGLAIGPANGYPDRHLGGYRMPGPDLVALWEAHCRYEFETRDVDATMATMVAKPYVNHVPTMTGGVGHDQLKRFYKYHFIGGNPPDMGMTPVSRTVGADQIVDEMIFSFTHTTEIDWLLPGVPPTGRKVEIPLVAIVRFVGEKVAHEHIYWDQASVLVQVGLLDPKGLPTAGVETARKVVDNSLPSNALMKRWSSSANKPL